MSRRERRVEILQRPGLVKICGLREPGHAVAAAMAGADLIGLVFARSKRQVTVEQARLMAREVGLAFGDASPLLVGVFVDPEPRVVAETVASVGLDVLQLHGSQPIARYLHVGIPVIQAVAPPPGTTIEKIAAELEAERIDQAIPALVMLDAYDPVIHGGTGRRGDWALAREIANQNRVLLAGGLSQENVGEAIREVRPRGVDVSSGVELNGIKDARLIRDFVASAKRGFAALGADVEESIPAT